jgi:hypothetical protein
MLLSDDLKYRIDLGLDQAVECFFEDFWVSREYAAFMRNYSDEIASSPEFEEYVEDYVMGKIL